MIKLYQFYVHGILKILLSYHLNSFTNKLATLLFFIVLLQVNVAGAQNLVHNFEFNGNFNDSKSTGISLTPDNIATSSFQTNPNGWTWTQPTSPGGGLVLQTDQLSDPQSYSLGFRIEFDQTSPGYKKILSFKGQTDDNGLYYHNSNLQFYPFGANNALTYAANTFYDFVFVRNSSDNIKVYIVDASGSVTQVYDESDVSDASVPHQVNGKYEFLFFKNDNVGTEHTTGGTIRGIRLWDAPLSAAEISGALSSVTTGDPLVVTSGSATFSGEVNPQGTSANFEFEYGETTAYGQTVTGSPASGTGNAPIAVQATVLGLKAETTYHYRLKSTNVSGSAYGSDKTFTTLAAPGGVTGSEIWLDASDPDADGDIANNPGDGIDITTWKDKSGNGNDVTTSGITQGGVNPPSYLNNQFNGKAALRFDKNNSEALGKILDSNYLGDFTVFIVLEGQTASPANFESFFSSWNDPNNASSFQIDYNSGSSNFQVRTTEGNVAFGPFNQELDLFTVRQENNNLETYSDGVLQNNLNVSTTKGFNAYRIGINRNAGSFYDSKIAEVIIYPRALNACEMEEVNDYLGSKYGRDYYNLASNFNHTTDFPNDVAGIGAFSSACSGNKTINEGISSILTINNPSSNDTPNEFLTLAHNDGTLTTSGANLPLDQSGMLRLEKAWKADRDGDVGTVDMQFDIDGISVSGTQTSEFLLVIDSDGDGDFNTGTTQVVNADTFANNRVDFNGVLIPDGGVFTLITGATPGPGVSGTNLWLKANNGTTSSGSDLTSWVDQSGINTFTKVGTLGLKQNAVNFNPTVEILNTNAPANQLPPNRLDGNAPITVSEAYAVYKTNSESHATVVGTTVSYPPSDPNYGNWGNAFFGGLLNKWALVSRGSPYQYYANPVLTDQFSINNFDVGTTHASNQSARFNGAFLNTTNSGEDFSEVLLTPMVGGTNNPSTSGWLPMDGEIAEILLFPSSLILDDKIKVESYLAVKYGVNLASSLGNYLASDNTIIWGNTTYWNDVFGVGKDDGSGLNQIQSNSINTGSGDGTGQSGKGNIVISSPTSLDDGDFIMIGHDNGALTEQSTGLPDSESCFARLTREWKVAVTNDPGAVMLSFDLKGLTVGGSDVSDFKILIDSDGDGDFTSGASSVVASSLANNILTFNNLTLVDGVVFTFITGTETIQPTITTSGPIMVSSDSGGCTYASSQLTPPTTSDNCGVASVVASPSTLVLGSNTVTWTVTDDSGNTATSTQTVTVEDNELPTVGTSSPLTVSSDAGVCTYAGSQLTPPTTSDNCGVASVVASPSSLVLGSNTVTWTVTDNSGNIATSTQEVTVEDNELPTITTLGDLTFAANAGVCTYEASKLPQPTTDDNCGVASVVPNPSVLVLGVNTVTWTVTDVSGNVNTVDQSITIIDNEKPNISSLSDFTVEADTGVCTYDSSQLPPPVTNDNCGVASVVVSPSVLSLGANTVTWTVTDDSGNKSTSTHIVTVQENELPTIATLGAITVHSDAGVCTYSSLQLPLPATSDNCGVASVVANPSELSLGLNTVTWTVTDDSGNTQNSIQEVTVVDNEDPIIGTLSAISVNTDSGECTYNISQLPPPTTSDNCGVASIVPSQSILSLGLNTITWTVTDDSGNTRSSIQEITVLDNVAPIVSCPSDQTVNPGSGNLYILPDYFGTSEVTVFDYCTNPITILTQSPNAGTQLADGIHTITFTAEDASGNIGDCSFDLTVDSTLGVVENTDVLKDLKLYPNPTSSIVKIQNLSNIKLTLLTIYDMMGRVINSIDLKQMGEEKEIDLSSLESAVYLFEIHSEQGKLVKSVVKR
ncbi:HYR domain-containing protein [Aestuariibaculum sediminum]|uniref:HYR domain-containing protein n=1 Tax=Aestuariibaculum sediminum TaxID=2770637 RepID=A0A8J6Q0Q3_9FLAO|nr:HYR domain-containing protein [Aestuariibaculum sediminum]MBD0833393.1 HYR domain-containing protein [Aestuariibaculum sediminum]